MSRVMLVCPEPLGHGQPAGIGIRFVEIARVLAIDGHDVTVLTPGGGTVSACRCQPLTPETLAAVSEKSDVAIVQGHAANDLFAHARPIPTVVDLYDPFIIENLHYFAERGDEVFTHDHATLMRSIARGDLFLCASPSQRLFYLGMLLAAGRLNPAVFESDPDVRGLLRIAPFGVQPARPLPDRDLDHPAVLFGGIYDWYDPLLAIDAVAIARISIPALTLTFTHHPNPDLTPQGMTAEAVRYVKEMRYDSFVRFEAWSSYSNRGAFFERFSIALLTFPQSIETDLSMRTRIYDYLWSGLPIVSSAAPGTGELLSKYGTGVNVEESSAEAFAAALTAALRDRERYARMVAGTRTFVREHQWEIVLGPLIEFCRNPRIDETKDVFAASLQIPERPRSILARIRRRIGGRT
jgi:glycosyltransferase involved in cell wall biosynthesis